MTIEQFVDACMRGETTEQYYKRQRKLKKYIEERDFLIDAIEILTDETDKAKREKKQKRLATVKKQIELLK